MSLGKPNIVLPLASSYEERGVAGFTNSQVGLDQRKINCFYEVTKNSLTGAGKIRLTKRPGVTQNTSTFNTTSQTAYLIAQQNQINVSSGALGISPFVFFVDTSSTLGVVSWANIPANITTITNYNPYTVDRTSISGQDNIVLQTRPNFPTFHRIFFGKSILNFQEITTTTFTSSIVHCGKMEQMDGFGFILNSSSQIMNSDSNSLFNWTLGNFITKSIFNDPPIGLAKFQNQILAFGERNVEAFYNAGNPTGSPLSRITQLQAKVGMVDTAQNGGTHYYAVLGKGLYFVGRDSGGLTSLGFFVYDGASYTRISNPGIDKILSEKYDGIYSVNSLGINGKGAISIGFDPPTSSSHRSLVYFPEWRDWFECNSGVFSPVNDGQFFLGTSLNPNRVYSFDRVDNFQDAGTSYTMQTQFKLPNDGAQNKFMAKYGVTGDTSTTAQGLLIEFSDDDYQTWQTANTLDLTQSEKYATRGGRYYDRAVRITSTTAAEVRLSSFNAWVTE